MLRRIVLENFMSHRHTEINLDQGLTVLTGPNNCGKSAIVAALQIVATNPRWSNQVIRHGAKECRITLETSEGHVICWVRNRKSVHYSIDGEDIHRIGNSLPDSLHEKLRLDRWSSEGGKYEYDIHFGEQKAPVFLLNEPGSRAASFFASSSDAAKLVEMQHLHRTRVADVKKEAKRLQAERDANELRLNSFQPLPAIEERLESADQLQHQIQSQQRQAEQLRQLVRAIDQRVAAIGRAKAIREQLNRLQPLPPMQNVRQLAVISQQIQQTQVRVWAAQRILKCCTAIQEPPQLVPVVPCRQLHQNLIQANRRLARARVTASALRLLPPPPAWLDTGKLKRLVPQLDALVHKRSKLRQQSLGLVNLRLPPLEKATVNLQHAIRVLQQQQAAAKRAREIAQRLRLLVAPPSSLDSQAVRERASQLEQKKQQRDRLRGTTVAVQQELDDCRAAIECYVRQFPKCSLCGNDLDPEQVISSVGPHLH